MIPIRDENPVETTPVVTYLLILVNVLVFVFVQDFGTNVGPTVQEFMLVPGAVVGGTARAYLQPAWLTIFTSMFLHGGLLHIGGNMLYLWIFGDNIEDRLGPVRFLAFYLICGLVAALTQIASAPYSTVPTLGASGAIAGVLGGYILLWPNSRILSIIPIDFFVLLRPVPAWLILGFWFVLQVFSRHQVGPGGGGVAYYAHIGGFLAGMALVRLLAKPQPPSRPTGYYHYR